MKKASTGKCTQHCVILILNHNSAKIITKTKLTNPKSNHNHSKVSLSVRTISITLSPISDATLNLHRDLNERRCCRTGLLCISLGIVFFFFFTKMPS